MAHELPLGPYQTVKTADGLEIPWYILPFDKEGLCTGPRTRDECLARVAREQFSDIVLFCHGWNNTWEDATKRYQQFLDGFTDLRKKRKLPAPPDYRPLLLGLFWPSIALLFPWEKAPRIAAVHAEVTTDDEQEAVANERAAVAELADALPAGKRARFYELTQAAADQDARAAEELLGLLLAAVPSGDELARPRKGKKAIKPTARRLYQALAGRSPGRHDEPGEGIAGMPGVAAAPGPRAAFLPDWLDPRNWVRGFTVFKMKDRAKVVGARGVRPLLADLLAASPARLHVLGHSYGCQVFLEALSAKAWPKGKQIDSALLLQPAVSAHCFAKQVHRTGEPGGYRPALGRVRQPLAATYSTQDGPLHTWYHNFVDRYKDAGERRPAARVAGPIVPYYAALGGYGPQGCDPEECTMVNLLAPVTKYGPVGQEVRVIGLESSKTIGGHGDICKPAVYWYLYQQVMDGR